MKLNTLILSLTLFGVVGSTLPMSSEPQATTQEQQNTSQHVENGEQVCNCVACNGTLQKWQNRIIATGLSFASFCALMYVAHNKFCK